MRKGNFEFETAKREAGDNFALLVVRGRKVLDAAVDRDAPPAAREAAAKALREALALLMQATEG